MDGQAGFLKRHGFVVAGVALPILVVLAFALARALPRLFVEDPRYDLLYSVVDVYSGVPNNASCAIAVVDGRVRARWSRSEEPVYGPTVRVYRLHPASGTVDEIAVPEPADLDAFVGTRDLFLGGLDGVRVDTGPRAPDGYAFESTYPGGSGLFGDIFFRGSRGPRSSITRSGRVIALPHTAQNPYGYESVTFIGWVIPVQDGR